MDAPTPPMHTEPGTLCLSLDVDELPGDRLAALVEAIDHVVNEDIKLVSYRAHPVRLELCGSWAALERVRAAVVHEADALRLVLGTCRPTTQITRGARPAPVRSSGMRRLVLLADSDPSRVRNYIDFLTRADIDVCVVSRGAAAQRLMQRTELPFDALVVRHRLPDFEALELLRRLSPEERRCSVLVIDERVRPEIARSYRVRGAHRYIAPPDGALQLIGRVHSTISETQAWRNMEEPSRSGPEEPPRLMLDPDQAADRLRYICGLSALEREVARMVLLGRRDLDIADRLGKSERTAKRHVGRVLEKAGIQNRASLWAVLHRDGRNDERSPRPAARPAESASSSPTPVPTPPDGDGSGSDGDGSDSGNGGSPAPASRSDYTSPAPIGW